MADDKIKLLGAINPTEAYDGFTSFETALVRAVNSFAAFYSTRVRMMKHISSRGDLLEFMTHVAQILRVRKATLILLDKKLFTKNGNEIPMPNIASQRRVFVGNGHVDAVMGNYEFVTFLAVDMTHLDKILQSKNDDLWTDTHDYIDVAPQGVLLTDFDDHSKRIMMNSSDSSSVKLVYDGPVFAEAGAGGAGAGVLDDDDDDDDNDKEQ